MEGAGRYSRNMKQVERVTVFKVRANKRRIEFVKSRGTRVTIEKAI